VTVTVLAAACDVTGFTAAGPAADAPFVAGTLTTFRVTPVDVFGNTCVHAGEFLQDMLDSLVRGYNTLSLVASPKPRNA